jgi:hypothetical protein
MKGVHGISWEVTGGHGSSRYMMEVRLGIYRNILSLCAVLASGIYLVYTMIYLCNHTIIIIVYRSTSLYDAVRDSARDSDRGLSAESPGPVTVRDCCRELPCTVTLLA